MGVLAEELLSRAEALGLRLDLAGDRIRVTGPAVDDALRDQLRLHRPAIIQMLTERNRDAVALRVAVFRTQIPADGPIPVLVFSRDTFPIGRCVSCGGQMSPANRCRCAPCAEAARQVIAEAEERRMARKEDGREPAGVAV